MLDRADHAAGGVAVGKWDAAVQRLPVAVIDACSGVAAEEFDSEGDEACEDVWW